MNDRLLVGNDIVDLRDRRCRGKSRHLRFVNRVFHPEEASRILSSPDADGMLWLHWAAKESAYKVASKVLGDPPVFAHASFRVFVDDSPEAGRADVGFNVSGRVSYLDWQLPFRASWGTDRIHALVWSGADPTLPAPAIDIATGEAEVHTSAGPAGDSAPDIDPFQLLLRERFTQRERRSIHSPASAHVRLMARSAVAASMRIDERRLEVLCGEAPTGRTPPRVYLDELPSAVDVSMSHHGQFVAWAYANADIDGVAPDG